MERIIERQPLREITTPVNQKPDAPRTPSDDIVQRLMSRIRELEHRLFDPEGAWGTGERSDGFMTKLAEVFKRLSTSELARMLLFADYDDDNSEIGSENLEAGSGQGRKAAAQAVTELTGRLAAAEEEAAALRRRLRETRSLTKIGQELEDVLAERDALKLVNQELAKRVTHPDSSGPCKGCMQASELKADIEVLKSASLEAAEHAESQQAEQSKLWAELASRSAELDQARQGAAQAAQHAQHSAAQAAEELAQSQRWLDECREELLRSRAAAERAEGELEMCQAGLKQSMEALHSVREELARSREALGQCQEDLLQSKEAEQRAADAARGLEQDRDRLQAVAGSERGRAEAAEAAALTAQHKLEALEAAQAQHAEHVQSLSGQVKVLQTEAADASAKIAALEERYQEERALRRRVHEELQVLRGNIRVMCRARPSPEASVLAFPLPGAITVSPPDRHIRDFEFNACFGPESSQAEVWEHVAPLIRSCADGFNACIFAYGQTGSGKTYTMQGPAADPGVNQRALLELFSATSGHEACPGADISVAMLEIYNEDVHDLLADESARQLDVCALGPGQLPPGVERIAGLTWRPVADAAEVASALAHGTKQRATSATAMNATSSRSHAVLSVKLAFADGSQSLLHLVDLAGSERIGRSEVQGQALKEAQSINKSLSALGDVICALQASAKHIPFRNSKLTQVLQDSLCGSSKVMLVCNLSPEAASATETLSSLNFASRAAQVELGPARKAAEGLDTSKASTPSSGVPSRRKSLATASPLEAASKKAPAEAKAKAVVHQDFAGRFHAA